MDWAIESAQHPNTGDPERETPNVQLKSTRHIKIKLDPIDVIIRAVGPVNQHR